MVEVEDGNPSVQPQKKPARKERRLWSKAWAHYDRKRSKDGDITATCNYCKLEIRANSSSGTTRLHNHLKIYMAYRSTKGKSSDVSQMLLKTGQKKKDGTNAIECFKFDPVVSRQHFANMFILHEYPFSMADHVGFRTFITSLQPEFKLLSRTTVQADCKKTVEIEKEKIYKTLEKLQSRVNLTADMWTALGNVGYLCMTCHYINEKWKLEMKILNFVYVESPHGAVEIAKVLQTHIYAWNIDTKLFSIVLDNCSTNDKLVKELLKDVNFTQNLIRDGDFFHSRCCAHVLNIIVQEGLQAVHDVVQKKRASVKFVKKSQARLETFRKCAQQSGAPEKGLILDCQTRWNSTYLMLEKALEFKKVFSRLPGFDKSYKTPPSSEDWDNAQQIVECLSVFLDATKTLSGTSYPTLNQCFNEIYTVQISLKSWCKSPYPFIKSMAEKMYPKFEKYWGKLNVLFTTSCILDPRFKLKSIEYFFGLVYENEFEVVAQVEYVRNEFSKMYDFYRSKCRSSSAKQSNDLFGKEVRSQEIAQQMVKSSRKTLRRDLGQFLQSSSSVQSQKSDLEFYLEEGTVGALDDDFDILVWWKLNEAKYPILSSMARDILAIPASTIASESAFSTGGRVVDQYRSRLDSDTVQALICGQDWLRHQVEDSIALQLDDALSTLFSDLHFDPENETLSDDNSGEVEE